MEKAGEARQHENRWGMSYALPVADVAAPASATDAGLLLAILLARQVILPTCPAYYFVPRPPAHLPYLSYLPCLLIMTDEVLNLHVHAHDAAPASPASLPPTTAWWHACLS